MEATYPPMEGLCLSTAGLIACGPAIAAVAAVVTTRNDVPLPDDIKSFTAFVACGVGLGVAFSFMLLDQQESRKQTAARFIVAAVLGVAIPRIMLKYLTWIHDFLNDPAIVIATGFVSAFVVYVIGYAIFRKVASRREAIANAAIKAGERATHQKFEEGSL